MKFLLIFVIEILIDWVSYIQPITGFNITAWNPLAAINLFFLLQSKVNFLPIILGEVTGNILTRSKEINSISNIDSILITTIYLIGSIIFRKYLSVFKIIKNSFDFLKFIVFSINLSLAHAIISITLYYRTGELYSNDVLISFFSLFVGDASGLIIIAPLLFVFMVYGVNNFINDIFENWKIIIAGIFITTFIYFLAISKQDHSLRFIYLIIIPICAAAFSFNLKNTLLLIAASQMMLAIAFLVRGTQAHRVAEIQLMILVISSTIIYIAMTIIERRDFQTKSKILETSKNLATISGILLHEIAQPITALSTYSQIQLNELNHDGKLDKNKLRTYAKNINDEISRVREIFLKTKENISAEKKVAIPPINVIPLVKTIFKIIQPIAVISNVNIKLNISSEIINIIALPHNISLAIKNLLLNSIQSSCQSIEKECLVEIYQNSELCFIDFIDSGNFISKKNLNNIFDYGYSSSDIGMGLGLSIAKDLIETSNGKIIAYHNQKMKFRIILPTIND